MFNDEMEINLENEKIIPVPEDTVEYFLYGLKEDGLEKLLFSCLALIENESKGYVWYHQGFNLSIVNVNGKNVLHGSTHFGNCADDEWFVVYLLHKITSSYPELIATVHDGDGEFLLIEAAECIPKWLSPTTSKNRIFISCGLLHIVPMPISPADINILPIGKISFEQSLRCVQTHPYRTQATCDVLACIKKRMEKVSEDKFKNVFYANVCLPQSLVALLDLHPNYISSALHTFLTKDPVSLRIHRKVQYHAPGELLWTHIPMSKNHYSQLLHENYKPVKSSIYYNFANVDTYNKGYDLGMKIACGFEIECSCERDKLNEHGEPGDYSFDDNPQFLHYIERLKSYGYFQGEIEGSFVFNKLKEKAKLYFRTFIISNKALLTLSPSYAYEFLEKWVLEENNNHLISLPVASKREDLPEETSDSFMKMSEKDLNVMLEDMNDGFKNLNTLENKSEPTSVDVKDMIGKVNSFINSSSSYEGVNMPSSYNPIQFDPETFMKSLEKMMSNCEVTDDCISETSNDYFSDDSDISSDGEVCSNMLDIMKTMDLQLSETNVKKTVLETEGVDEQNNEPLNIDVNLVENFLKSCENEDGSSTGAASVLINSLGLKQPLVL